MGDDDDDDDDSIWKFFLSANRETIVTVEMSNGFWFFTLIFFWLIYINILLQ